MIEENDTLKMGRCWVTSGLEPHAESHCEHLVVGAEE